MEKGRWLVANLPGDAIRVSRFASQFPSADIQLMHLGLEHQGGVLVHRVLLSVRGKPKAWRALRAFFIDDVGVAWQDLPDGEQDALLAFRPDTNIGENTRALLALWPHARVSCLRCRGGNTDLYALAADAIAADRLRSEILEQFGHRDIQVRDLDSEERTWFRRLLDNPVLMAAMNR